MRFRRSLFEPYTKRELAMGWLGTSVTLICGMTICGATQFHHPVRYVCFGLAFVGMIAFAVNYIALQKVEAEEREWQAYLDRTRDIQAPNEK